MPGLLIDDMPFSLDPGSSCSSLFFEPMSPSYIYSQTQLGSFLSSFSVPAVDKQQPPPPQQQQQQRSSVTRLSLDSPLSSSSADYPLWANASPRFSSADSSSSVGSLGGHNPGESAVKELLLEAAAMVAAAKGGGGGAGGGGSSGKKSSSASSQGATGAQPESPVAAALHKFLPSNSSDDAAWTADDVYSCDEFRMFEFKVRRCMRGRSHDWTECPFAHPGEKARRRDPRRFHYSGAACPDFRKGSCKNGDSCELAHGVFECWLHPARYRTQPCKDGRNCKRRVCFFAHTPEQLRLLPSATPSSAASPSSSVASSPKTRSGGDKQHKASSSPSTSTSSWSPTMTLVGLGTSPPPLSPPLSPSGSPPHSPSSISSGSCTGFVARHTLEQSHSYQRRSSFSSGISSPPGSPGAGYHSAFSSPCASPKAQLSDLVSALHQLELSKAAAAAAASPLWLQQQQQQQAQGYSTGPSPLRPGLFSSRNSSSPCTPNKLRWDCGAMWEMDSVDEEDMAAAAASPRLDSGLRAKVYGRMASMKTEAAASVVFNDPAQDEGSPDLNWVNELLVAE